MRVKKVIVTGPPVKKKGKGIRIPKKAVLKAIAGSSGIKSTIAERLCCAYGTVACLIRRWPEVEQAYNDELERVGDIAEGTVQEAMQQRLDISEASRTARWYLERRHSNRGFVEKTQMQLDGGPNPLRVQQQQQNSIPLDTLVLPVEVRKQILLAIQQQKIKIHVDDDPDGYTVTEGDE